MKWVRPLLAVLFGSAVVGGFFVQYITSEAFLPIASAVIVWWFKSRDDEKHI